MNRVELTDEELIQLQGKCRPEVEQLIQSVITKNADATRLNLEPKQAELLRQIKQLAITEQKVIFQRVSLSWCSVCGKSKSYHKYKSGPRKGDNNYERPIYLPGVELKDKVVSMKGHVSVGCCSSCFEPLRPIIAKELEGIPADVTKYLRPGLGWIRQKNKCCTACGWKGHEGQMGLLRTFMGDGHYHGKCPGCGAENRPLGSTIIETVDGHTLVREEETK